MKFRITVVFLTAVVLLVGCAPRALYMENGDILDQKIKEKVVKVAILPTVDYAGKPGFCTSYMLFGCAGPLTSKEAVPGGGYTFTNSIVSAMWKKNAVKLVKAEDIVNACSEVGMKKDDIYPEPSKMMCFYPKPVKAPDDVGKGVPNYEKLYDFGEKVGADIVLTSRLSMNARADYCSYNPIGSFPPYTTVIGVGQNVYNNFIADQKQQFISIDIMAFDVKEREPIAWGAYMPNEILARKKAETRSEHYSKNLTFYAPLPSDKDLEKEFLAKSGSQVTTWVLNMIAAQAGLQLGFAINITYEYEDETWKTYPPDFFEKNYAFSRSDYYKIMD